MYYLCTIKIQLMEKREKIIPVRVSLEEEKILLEKANKIGLKLSTYLRLSALEK